MLSPNSADVAARRAVLESILEHVKSNKKILLPEFQPTLEGPSTLPAPIRAGREPNAFGNQVGPYRYQFEGEDDLLHLMITRLDEGPLTAEQAQEVVAFLLQGVPEALIWLRPGHLSQHFYLGHDELLDTLILD